MRILTFVGFPATGVALGYGVASAAQGHEGRFVIGATIALLIAIPTCYAWSRRGR